MVALDSAVISFGGVPRSTTSMRGARGAVGRRTMERDSRRELEPLRYHVAQHLQSSVGVELRQLQLPTRMAHAEVHRAGRHRVACVIFFEPLLSYPST
jgi:hypothetical protein